VRLLTRRGLDWTDRYPSIAAAVAALSAHCHSSTVAASSSTSGSATALKMAISKIIGLPFMAAQRNMQRGERRLYP
jgi:ATP-dependent DNA ligase